MSAEQVTLVIEHIVGGETDRWGDLADRNMLSTRLHKAVIDAKEGVGPVDQSFEGAWRLIANRRDDLDGQIRKWYSQFGAGVAVDDQRLVRNLEGSLASAAAACAACWASRGRAGADDVVMWAHRASVALGGQLAVDLLSALIEPGLPPTMILDKAFDALSSRGAKVVAARLWSRFWFDQRVVAGDLLKLLVAGADAHGQGFVTELSLWSISHRGGELVEHPDMALYPLGPALLDGMARARATRSIESLCWLLIGRRDTHGRLVPLDGDSFSAAAAIGVNLLAEKETWDTEALVMAGVADGEQFGPVGAAIPKLRAAAEDGRVTRVGLALGTEFDATRFQDSADPLSRLEPAWLRNLTDGVEFVTRERRLAMVPVIAVLGTRGGVGKGTLVAAMGQLMADAGHNVAVIDLDVDNSGTTLAALAHHPLSAYHSVKTVYDTLAPFALGFEDHVGETDEALWDITPPRLAARSDARISLLPSRREINEPKPFDVVANVPLPREPTLSELVETMVRRVTARTAADCVLIDCGAAANPIFAAAMRVATYRLIIADPDPAFVANVKALEAEFQARFPRAKMAGWHVLVNKVSTAAEVRLAHAFNHSGTVHRDPLLEAHAREVGVDLDLGYPEFVESLRTSVAHCLRPEHQPLLPTAVDVGRRSWWALVAGKHAEPAVQAAHRAARAVGGIGLLIAVVVLSQMGILISNPSRNRALGLAVAVVALVAAITYRGLRQEWLGFVQALAAIDTSDPSQRQVLYRLLDETDQRWSHGPRRSLVYQRERLVDRARAAATEESSQTYNGAQPQGRSRGETQ